MHPTNGVLENSGKEDGTMRSAQSRDRIHPMPTILPEDSELSQRSVALRTSLYSNASPKDVPRHYVRKPHCCDNCQLAFSSKDGLRNHMFEKHSY
jgi:hypothetical protein